MIEAAGFSTHAFALCEDGNLYAWGSNYFGELVDGNPVVNNGSIKDTELIENNMPIAQKVQIERKVIVIAARNGGIASIEAGGGHTFVMAKEGKIDGWGANACGQLGLGDKVN